MNRILPIGLAICSILLLVAGGGLPTTVAPLSSSGQASEASSASLLLTVSRQPLIRNIPRIGVNLGGRTAYGAEQYRQNVLLNPGFEPLVEGRILEVANPTAATFEDNVNWVGKGPIDWYKGATFSVRSGPSAGATGTISGYNPNGDGYPTFTCTGGCPSLHAGDEISMYFTDPPEPGKVLDWWTSDRNLVQTNLDHEPQSKGRYSLQATLDGASHRIDSYLDGYNNKSINFLPVAGTWRLSFWAKAVDASPDASVAVNFLRLSDGAHPNNNFISQQAFMPTNSWRQFSYTFSGKETATLGTLDLMLTFGGTRGAILLDDVSLGPTTGSDGWRSEVVSTLMTLHPGVLRDWQNFQLGEPYQYRTGDSTEHGPSSYNGPNGSSGYSYTITDFLALASTIGAEPWIIIPDTSTDEELRNYGQYLEQKKTQFNFAEIMVELGNENWNGEYRGAGIIPAANYGAVAQRDFTILKQAASNDPTLKFVGAGQYGSPEQVGQVAKAIPAAPYIAVAPYFWGCQNAGQTTAAYLTELFSDGWTIPSNALIPIARNLQRGQTAAVYEENLATQGGSASTTERNSIVAGYGSGGALAQQILRVMNAGFRVQNVWNFTQLANATQKGWWGFGGQCQNNPPSGALVPLYGIVHDLNPASNLIRPTGLAVQLANMAIGGDFYPIDIPAHPGISGAAFLASGKWSALLSNGTASSQTIDLAFPAPGPVPTTLKQLRYTTGPSDNNETSALVSIGSGSIAKLGNNQVSLTITPWGAVALLP